MAEGQALTEEAVQAGLVEIRLPADAPGGLIAELAAGAGMGLGLALCIALLLRPVLRGRERPPAPASFAQRLAAADALPEEQREIALLTLWREADPSGYGAQRSQIYARGGVPEGLERRLGADA
ncbi:hypothetical protein [Vannielia litorea]|uniref:hypothetical protein n=1 Tax=Vannielia litorea TaxID=1217970 RepID=UPI001C965C7C|nr:hypothetical protein [Vannielia litorea]MBY6047200.1 hypothetical protein [Vannielia litorea]MBY6074614.1 hypothetical protein [Vannielia litorea]